MGKHIRKFQSLTQEDQIMLLKGGVVEVSIFLRYARHHNTFILFVGKVLF